MVQCLFEKEAYNLDKKTSSKWKNLENGQK